MHRRCNYDKDLVKRVQGALILELVERHNGSVIVMDPMESIVASYYDSYLINDIVDVVILPYLNTGNISKMSSEYISRLLNIIADMLVYDPFELVTIHDSFASSPMNVNWVRFQYKEILADLAESNILDDLLSQLYGTQGTFEKLSKDVPARIRNSNYALT